MCINCFLCTKTSQVSAEITSKKKPVKKEREIQILTLLWCKVLKIDSTDNEKMKDVSFFASHF